MNRIKTYCPLYHDEVHNDPLVDHNLQHHIPNTPPRETPIINISNAQPCPKRERLYTQKSCTIIYTYRCGHEKIITFNILPLNSPPNSPSNSLVPPYAVINQTYNFRCLTITSLQNKSYPLPIQNTMTHVIHNNICHPVVSYSDLLQLTTPNHHTPPMICLNIIKMRIASKETNDPLIRPFRLRCGHIRSIQVAPKCIHNKQKRKLDRGNKTPKQKTYDSATSKKQLKQKSNITNNLSFGDILQNKHKSVTRFLYQNTGSLGLSTDSHNIETLCNAMYEHDVAVGCFAETNTHWRHPQTIKRLLKVASQFW